MNRTNSTKMIASLRIIIPLWITFILIVLSLFFIFVPSLEENIINQKRSMIRNLTDNNWSLLSEYHQMVMDGEITIEVAQLKAKRQIRGLRYGPEGKDYFWINDMHPIMVMHPYFPNLEGGDLTNYVDPKGKHLFVEFVKTVKANGSGYVDYMWQWKDDQTKIVPKISYVKGFEPWGWIIGTGIYIEDAHKETGLIIQDLLKIFTGLLIVIIIISSYITWQTIKIEKKRSLAEENLLKSEKNYRIIFENTGTATVIIEKNMIISLANDKFIELSGYSREEIEGKKTWSEFVVPYDLKKMKEQHEARRKKGEEALKTYEFRFIDKNNNIKHILLSVDIVPGTEKSVSSLLDITKRKETEQALKSSHKRFLTVLNSIDATIYVSDMETYEIIFMNKYMIESFGGDKTGEICWKVFGNKGKPCSQCNNDKLLDKNNRPTGVHRWQGESPITKKWYTNYDRAIEWEGGQLVKLQIATDITYLKNVEEELRQAHKMESIGTLAGGIAHDFNNILFPIVGYTEMLLQAIPEESPFRDNLSKIHTSALRARDLVKQILTFSRQDISELKLIKIQPIIKEALKFIRSSIPTTINIKQNITENCGLIKADPTQIHQIVMNLSTNAYHAMERTGGELNVNLKEIKQDKSDAITPDIIPGRYACLTITDTGTGMEENISEKIFDPFFTTKEHGKGTGLGLSVVHGIVKNMNGTVQVKSELEKGTEFNIFLPIFKGHSNEQKTQLKEPILKGDEKVLLIDDEKDIVAMEKQMLEHFGYHVTAHTESTEALDTFRDNPDKFDIVITDMAMPNMPGDKLANELTKIRSDIPILLCTGYSGIMSEEKAASIGIKGFLMKPIVMKDLAGKIREVLDKKG